MRLPFAGLRQRRTDERELGTGLWRRSHDLFGRALERYWMAVLDERAGRRMPEEELNGLVHAGNVMADLLPRVRAACVAARQRHGEDEERIPLAAAVGHRALSRASNELAAVAQAAALVRWGQTDAEAVSRHAQRVIGYVEEAERELG